MSFGIPVRNGLSIGLLASTFLTSRSGRLVPRLTLNFLTGAPLDSRITFSRTTNATLVDSTGRVTYAPNNLLLYSEQFDNAGWVKSNATVTANATASPDGTTTADKLVEDSSNTSHFTRQNATGVIGTTYTSTVFVKAAERTAAVVTHFDGSAFCGVSINLSTGALSTPPADLGLTDASATSSVQNFGNGWFRVSVTRTQITTTTLQTRVFTQSGSNGIYLGNGTSGVFLWGAQLEAVTYQTTPGTYNSTSPPNLFGFTEEFNNAYWTKAGATISPDATAAPNGSTTADKLVEDSSTGQHRFYGTAASTTNTGSYTVSFFAKAAERTRVYVGVAESPTFVRQGNAVFDLSAGTVVSANAGSGGASGGSATIQDAGNGWYRCSYTLILGGANTSIFVDFNLVSTGVTISYTGNGTSGLFLWGAQLSNSASVDPYVYNPGAALTSTAYYGPRFDYDPVTLAPRGLLIEEQRVNLALYSEQFDNAVWSKSAGSVTANSVTSPDGTANADTFVTDTSTTFHTLSYYASASGAAGVSYTTTVYLKAAANTFFRVQNDASGFGAQGGQFDLTAVTASVVGSATAASITPVGNGWFRCSVTSTSTGAFTAVGLKIFPTNVAGNGNIAGTGTASFYVWGAQTELGAFATSYIPTVASTVTRAADNAVMTGANFSSWYNQSEGTMVAFYNTTTAASLSNNLGAFGLSDGTTNERIQIRRLATTSTSSFIAVDNGVVQYTENSLTVASGAFNAALAYKLNDFQSCTNGTLGTPDTSGTLPTPTQAEIGFGQGLTYLNGYMRSITFYPSRLTNAQLQALTA